MILTYNAQVLAELFDVDLNDDTLILGTYAPWSVYDPSGHVVMEFGDDITMEFDVVENHRVTLENCGVEIYFDIEWVE